MVVDREPFLVVEDRLVGGADAGALPLEDGHRLAPVAAAVGGAAHRHVALGDEGAALAADVLQLRHQRHAVTAVERRRRVAGAVAAAHRDLPVDPAGAAVERGEEAGRNQGLARPGRVVEPVEVVVGAGDEVVRVGRVDGDRDLVVRVPVLVVLGGVAADVDRGGRVAGAGTAEPLDLLLGELPARVAVADARPGLLLLGGRPPLEGHQVGRAERPIPTGRRHARRQHQQRGAKHRNHDSPHPGPPSPAATARPTCPNGRCRRGVSGGSGR